MEISSSNNQQNFQNDIEKNNQQLSLAQYSQMHPYQYLKQLNNVYQTCNRSACQYYSTASMIKLPWKKFNFVSIPKCFQQSYNLQKKQTCLTKNVEQNQKSQQELKQKRFWKEHQDLIRKYHQNNIKQNNMKKNKMEQRRKILASAKSNANLSRSSHQNSSVQQKSKFHKQNSLGKNNLSDRNKQNDSGRFSTIKTQSDQTQIKEGFIKKNSILTNQRKMPFTNVQSKDKNNIYFKKLLQKGADLRYDQTKLQQQVLQKLRKISIMPNYNRAKTANLPLRQKNKNKQKLLRRQVINNATIEKASFNESRIKERQYLQFNKQQELIERYKSKIKQIDCSISQKNVKKTIDILKQMQQLADFDIDNY